MWWWWAVFLFMAGFIIYKGRSLTAICGRQGSQNHTACDPKQNCFLLQIWKWTAGQVQRWQPRRTRWCQMVAVAGVEILNCTEPRKIILTDILERWRYWFWCFIMNILPIKSSKCWSYLHIAGRGKTMRWKKEENPYNRQLVFCLRETKRRISWHPEQGPWQEIKLPFNTFKTFNGEKGCKLPWVQTEGVARCGEEVMLLNLAIRNSNEMSGYDVIGAGPGHNETSGSK